MDQFLKRCFYHSGQYDSQDHFAELDKKLKEHEVRFGWFKLFKLGWGVSSYPQGPQPFDVGQISNRIKDAQTQRKVNVLGLVNRVREQWKVKKF